MFNKISALIIDIAKTVTQIPYTSNEDHKYV